MNKFSITIAPDGRARVELSGILVKDTECSTTEEVETFLKSLYFSNGSTTIDNTNLEKFKR